MCLVLVVWVVSSCVVLHVVVFGLGVLVLALPWGVCPRLGAVCVFSCRCILLSFACYLFHAFCVRGVFGVD